jgi:hypothetical protein
MEQNMKAKQSTCIGTMDHSGKGHPNEFLAASEQLYTGSCARCAGLLVSDWCYDLINTGEHNAEVFRCVQCGHRVDPVILQNKARSSAQSASAGNTHYGYCARTAVMGEAA